jgi:hypothetical protein
MNYFTKLFSLLFVIQLVNLIIVFSCVKQNVRIFIFSLFAIIGFNIVTLFLFRKYVTGEAETLGDLFGSGFTIIFSIITISVLFTIGGVLYAVKLSNESNISKVLTVPIPFFTTVSLYSSLIIVAKISGDKN